MILLITGTDPYQKNTRLNEIMKLGENLYDSLNIKYVDEKTPFSDLYSEVFAMPFLSKKRLLIGKNILSSKNSAFLEKVSEILENVPQTTDLVFIEDDAPDQRKTLFKSIKTLGKIEIYNPLKQYEVLKWIKNTIKNMKGTIDEPSTQMLFLYCGNDLFRLENEISKLLNYDKNITRSAIENLVKPEFSNSIFELMDAISEKKAQKAVAILNQFFKNNENELYITSMLVRQIKNLLIIKSLKDKNLTETEIVKTLKLHPFVIKKTLFQCKNFSIDELKALHTKLLKLDLELKTNTLDPKLILTNFIFEVIK